MYQIESKKIPQSKREQTNEDILFSIDEGGKEFSRQEIYNSYTGLGGLHGLHQSDYPNYNEYAQAKKEFEMGQFFTPHDICLKMVSLAAPEPTEMVLDMCCGIGNFLNFLPNQSNAYGFDIDPDAIKVAKHLYPEANLRVCDIMDYRPAHRVDMIIGNPPFNLDFKGKLSQFYYINKAHDVLNPAGLLMIIVPHSFLSSEFWEKSRVKSITRDFSFIGQTELPADAFASVGVEKFRTKIMVFMRESRHIEMKPYSAEEFVTMEVLGQRISQARQVKKDLRMKILRETNVLNLGEEQAFQYRLNKYLYELKAHKKLNKQYDKALALVTKFRNQRPPDNANKAQMEEWERSKLTYPKVLSVIERYIKNQNYVPRKEIALVRTSYGFKLKEFAPRMLDKVEGHKYISINDLLTNRGGLPGPVKMTAKLHKQYALALKTIERKRRAYLRQEQPILEMERDPVLDGYISRTSFINPKGNICRFTKLQQHDMGLVFQKRYSLLNWQQGSGKTAVAYHYGRYQMTRKAVKNVVVLAPSIAVHLTWVPFLQRMNKPYVVVSKRKDLENIQPGVFVVVSLSMIGKLKRELMRFMKLRSRKVCLLFDESDEITNPLSHRTRTSLDIFRRSKYKMLATGTTTRNNIGELYPQIEMLYNNSVNMISWCSTVYHEFEGDITEDPNDNYGMPFPARGGANLFKACFCPGKTTVFGIEKQNQDVYNKEHLWELIAKTILTRKFKEFAGEKYKIFTHTVAQSDGEKEVYRIILEEFYRICHLYFKKLDDSKKEASLRLVRQIMLMIKACSTPNLMSGYSGDRFPNKAKHIGDMIDGMAGKVSVGCTSLEAVAMYAEFLEQYLPERPLFVIQGNVTFRRRQKIIEAFEATADGILVCTQQSLKSSVNIPSCDEVILEAMLWNVPRMEQFYFRFIRLDSENMTNVHFVTYEGSIEANLMALVLTKERLNDFIRSGEVKDQSQIFDEFDVSSSLIHDMLQKQYDSEGNMHLGWGQQKAS